MGKNKVGDVSILISHLAKAFEQEQYRTYLLDIFLTMLWLHRDGPEASRHGRQQLTNVIKVFIREGVLARAIDILTDGKSVKLCQKACMLLILTLEQCQSKIDTSCALEAQQIVLNYLMQSKKFEGLFRKVRKILEGCVRRLRKRQESESVNIYDASLFLSDLNLSQVIEKINRVDPFLYTGRLLRLLCLLSRNSFMSFQVWKYAIREYG